VATASGACHFALPLALDDMKRFYEPDLTSNPDTPFIRDGNGKLVRRSYWMDMDDRTFLMVMTKGIGAHLTNDENRAHLTDLRRDHLIDPSVCSRDTSSRKVTSKKVKAAVWNSKALLGDL
jgi:hypothetical protein